MSKKKEFIEPIIKELDEHEIFKNLEEMDSEESFVGYAIDGGGGGY